MKRITIALILAFSAKSEIAMGQPYRHVFAYLQKAYQAAAVSGALSTLSTGVYSPLRPPLFQQSVREFKTVSNSEPLFPEAQNIQFVQKLAGGTGPELVTDSRGTYFVRKSGGGKGGEHRAHLENEYRANLLYSKLGVPVRHDKFYETQGPDPQNFILCEYVEGETLKSYLEKLGFFGSSSTWNEPQAGAKIEKVKKELQSHFVADCLLGNYDVIGAHFDNILIDTSGTPLRIDNGGALEFRALGLKKLENEFGEVVSELETLRGRFHEKTPDSWKLRPFKNAARIFDDISDQEIIRQIDELLKIEGLLDPLPADLKKKIEMRLQYLERYGNRLRRSLLLPGFQRSDWQMPKSARDLFQNGQSDTSNRDSANLIQDLSEQSKILKHLFEASAHVDEGYSIGLHTEMVLAQFEAQKNYYRLDNIQINGTPLSHPKKFLRAVIALHDIGKSLGPRALQHENTIPILRHFMAQLGFTENEVRLAVELVNHDLIGKMARQWSWLASALFNTNSVASQLQEKASRLNMTPEDFMTLQTLLYVSDASSYPEVRQSAFTEARDGRLTLRSGFLEKLSKDVLNKN